MSYTKGVTCSPHARESRLKPLVFSEGGVLLHRQMESLICWHWKGGISSLILLPSSLMSSVVFICTCDLLLNLLTLQCKITGKTMESVKMKERVSPSAVLWKNTETSDESHLLLSKSCKKAYEHNEIVQAHLIHIHLPSCDNSIVPEFCDSVERILGPYLFHLALNTWKSSCICFQECLLNL